MIELSKKIKKEKNMSNRRVHTIIGIGSAVMSNTDKLKNTLKNNSDDFIFDLALTIAGGYLGSRLPDLLEPATHPNHRSQFHSVTTGVSLNKLVKNHDFKNSCAETLSRSFCAGYSSHLVLDSMTPKGIPFIK